MSRNFLASSGYYFRSREWLKRLPYYTQDVREIVPWEMGKKAILDSARQAASR
jgi:hypothetical protein